MLILFFEPLSLTLPLSTGTHLRIRGRALLVTITRPGGAVIGHVVIPVVAQMCYVVDADWTIAQA